ncbi:hypothetical protein T492DRAFT_1145870 [Pavlovales sp. CCMP2436]|nr:hypothetical protein T492DRAFT_1145870 [Pavlovales sp. CCMP2436]
MASRPPAARRRSRCRPGSGSAAASRSASAASAGWVFDPHSARRVLHGALRSKMSAANAVARAEQLISWAPRASGHAEYEIGRDLASARSAPALAPTAHRAARAGDGEANGWGRNEQEDYLSRPGTLSDSRSDLQGVGARHGADARRLQRPASAAPASSARGGPSAAQLLPTPSSAQPAVCAEQGRAQLLVEQHNLPFGSTASAASLLSAAESRLAERGGVLAHSDSSVFKAELAISEGGVRLAGALAAEEAELSQSRLVLSTSLVSAVSPAAIVSAAEAVEVDAGGPWEAARALAGYNVQAGNI